MRTIGPFRGATERGFGDRIRSHRLFLGAGIFKPVRLNFRKPGNPFELVSRPRARRADPVRYVFSPTFQLTFPFSPVNNLFFETNTAPSFRWLVTEMNRPGPAGQTPGRRSAAAGSHGGGFWHSLLLQRSVLPAPPATISHGGGFWHGLLQFRNYRVDLGPIQPKGVLGKEALKGALREGALGKGDLVLPREGRSAGALVGGRQSRGVASRGAPAAPFFTILRTVQLWTRTLSESLGRPGGVLGREGGPPRGGRIRETEKILVLLRPDFGRGGGGAAARAGSSSHVTLKTVEAVNAVALRQSFFTRLTLHAHGGGQAASSSPGGAFAAPSITFAAPRPADAARRDEGFVQPVDLSYARREPPQLQAVVNALRDLHPPQSEARPVPAPQLPSIEQLASQVSRQLEQEFRIEKERRGR